MWGVWNVFTEDGEMFGEGHLRNAITPTHSSLIEYTPIDEIGDNPHIYIINVYSHQFFGLNKDLGFSCMSEKYINDVRNGKAKILLLFIYEGYSGTKGNDDYTMIDEWRKQIGFPVDSVYYVCGNLLSDKIVKEKGLGIQARGVHYFEPWNKYHGGIVDYNPIDEKYLFLSYNRQPRYQRIRFMMDLFEQKLIDKGLISLSKINGSPYLMGPEMTEFFTTKLPLVIDEDLNLQYNLACNITPRDFERTFISVVTETLVDDNTLFFSEKIWKPIMVGHPFMVYGNQYSLQYLKSLGYKTFDRWVDESYDLEPDRDVRSKMIVNELCKLNLKSIDELKKIREEMFEVCEHNHNHYKTTYIEKYGDNDQNKTIRDILLEMWGDLNNE